MAGRHTGVLVKRLSGEGAREKLALARTLMGRMKAYLAGRAGSKVWRMADGTVIVTHSSLAGDIVTISAIEGVIEEILHGILCIPRADEAEDGWGDVVTDLDKPLGVPNGTGNKQVRLGTPTLGSQFSPDFRITRHTNIDAGTLQWHGRNGRVWWLGPPSKHWHRFTNKPETGAFAGTDAIWTSNNTKISTTGTGVVLGAAIFDDGTNRGYIVASTQASEGQVKIFIQKSGAWVQIGSTYTFPTNDFNITMVMFNQSANKCAFVTQQGAVVEFTITWTNYTANIVVPRIVRGYAASGTYDDNGAVTEFHEDVDSSTTYIGSDADFDYYTGESSFDQAYSSYLTTGDNLTMSTTLLELSPTNYQTELSSTTDLTWEKAIACDYIDDELVWASLRFTGYQNGVAQPLIIDPNYLYPPFVYPPTGFYWYHVTEFVIDEPFTTTSTPAGTPYRRWFSIYPTAPTDEHSIIDPTTFGPTATMPGNLIRTWAQAPKYLIGGSTDDSNYSSSYHSDVAQSNHPAAPPSYATATKTGGGSSSHTEAYTGAASGECSITLVFSHRDDEIPILHTTYEGSYSSSVNQTGASSRSSSSSFNPVTSIYQEKHYSETVDITYSESLNSSDEINTFSRRIRFLDLKTCSVILQSIETEWSNVQTGSISQTVNGSYTFDHVKPAAPVEGGSGPINYDPDVDPSVPSVPFGTSTTDYTVKQGHYHYAEGELVYSSVSLPNTNNIVSTIYRLTAYYVPPSVGVSYDGSHGDPYWSYPHPVEGSSTVTHPVPLFTLYPDDHCRFGYKDDSATFAEYARPDYMHSGANWELGPGFTTALYTEGKRRNAEEIFGIDETTHPRFTDIKSY